MEPRHLGVAVRLNLKTLVVEDPRQLLDRLSPPLRDQVRMKLMPYRYLRDRPLPLNRLRRDLRLELGREPVFASSWWIFLLVIESTLATCLRNRDHLSVRTS